MKLKFASCHPMPIEGAEVKLKYDNHRQSMSNPSTVPSRSDANSEGHDTLRFACHFAPTLKL